MNSPDIGDATTRLAAAAEALEQTIARITASQDTLHAKIDRIIAAIDDRTAATEQAEELERRIAALERENADLKAAAQNPSTPNSQNTDPENDAGAPPLPQAHASDRVRNDVGAPPLSRAHASDRVGTTRKTLAPFVSALLSKSATDDVGFSADPAVLDKALASLSLEQRVAVKAEMARAGLIA